MKRFTTTIIGLLVLYTYERAGAQIIANAGNDTSICNGNSIILGGNPTATGGTPPYNYAWSNGLPVANPIVSPDSTTIYYLTVTDNLGATATDMVTVFLPSPLVIDSLRNPTTCNGIDGQIIVYGLCDFCPVSSLTYYKNSILQGPFLLAGSGGPYTAIGALSSGTYTDFVIIDGPTGCTLPTFAGPYVLSDPQSPIVNAGLDQSMFSCPGSSVILGGTPTASGGSSSYLYSWSPSVALNNNSISNPTTGGLTVTTYFNVTVTDISTLCSATDQVIVTVIQSNISAEAGIDNSICIGDSAILGGNPTVAGGSPPYIYQWSPGSGLSNPSIPNPVAMPSQTTTFRLVAADIFGCQATDSVTVFVGNLQVDSITGLHNVCFGDNYGSACVYVSGGSSSYSYLWNSGQPTQCLNNLYAGSYFVIVSDSSGCSVSSSVIINEYPELRVDSVAMRSISCYGGNDGTACIYLSGGPPPYFYVWSNSGQGQCQSNLLPGFYNATVGDGNNCTASANGIITQPAHLNLQMSSYADGILPDTFCVTASGGTSPYLYDPGFNTNSFGNGCYQLVSGTFSITVTDASGCNITSSGSCAGFQIDSAVSTNFPCLGSGSTGCVYPSGGTLPYSYNWSGGQTNQCIANLPNGIYSPAVTVTDANNCSGYATVNINQPSLFYIYSLYHRDDTCGRNTGWADVSVTGGTGPRTYLWSNGGTHASVTNLAAGIYSVTVTDGSGCSVSSTVTIAQLPLFTTQISSSTSGILPDTLCVTVGGGTAPFNYQWSGNVNPLQNNCFELLSGSFFITITDAHGCSVTDNVYSGGTLVADAGSDRTICLGGFNPITLGGSPTGIGGNAPYSYQWFSMPPGFISTLSNPLVSNLVTTSYYLTVTDNLGATAIDSVIVFVNPTPVIDSLTSTGVSCFGGNNGSACVYASGGTSSFSFEWANGPTNSCQDSIAAGTYSVIVTDANFCTVTAMAIITQAPQLLIDSITSINVTCHGTSDGSGCIYVSGGTPGYTFQWTPPITIASCGNNLAAGTYPIRVTDLNSCFIDTSISIYEPLIPNCVWPGDADFNGLADNNDLLAIGLGYGATGPVRALQNINWYAHQCTDWVDTLTTGTNYKHIDCNGNGIINADDTVAIIQNFGQAHAKTDEAEGWRSVDPALYVDLLPDTTQAGDTMYATLTLGDINIQASNVYGLAFTIHYDPNVVDSSKTRAIFGNSWLGTSIDKISIAKDLKSTGELKCALTRIDHTTRSGFGQIGQVEFVITTDNINGKDLAYYQMNVWISDITMIDNLGNYLTVNAGRDSSQVEFEPTSVGNPALAIDQFKMIPNPANDEVLLVLSENLIGGEIKLLDVEGRILTSTTISTSNFKLQTANFANGIYFLRLRTESGLLTRRLLISHP